MGRRKCEAFLRFDALATANPFETDNVKIYLLPILGRKISTAESENRYLNAFMIQETGEQRGQYRRIGTLSKRDEIVEGLEELSIQPLGIGADIAGSSSPDGNWNRGEDFTPGLVDETKCVEIRVDEDRGKKKRYIIDLV
jgi:hypothetical protein